MKIAVMNQSKQLDQMTLGSWLHAIEYQVKRHFRPYWALTAELRLCPRQTAPEPEEFKILILDSPADVADAGYYGYHALDDAGKPMAYVFLDIIKSDGRTPSVVLSHEILEMILDPFCWATALTPYASMRAVSVEACDPVQGLTYRIDDVWVSDFVLPDYFVPCSDPPYDYLSHLKKPLSVARGGYLLVWTPAAGWGEKSASRQETGKKHAFSRTQQVLRQGKKPARRQGGSKRGA